MASELETRNSREAARKSWKQRYFNIEKIKKSFNTIYLNIVTKVEP